MIVLVSIFLLLYVVFIATSLYGWQKSTGLKRPDIHHKIFLSVVIPYRNEINNITSLVKSLSSQNYSVNLWEVIAVNDHSDDNGPEILQSLLEESGLKYQHIHLHQNEYSKKTAITKGVEYASGNYILTTDADIQHPVNWLSGLSAVLENERPELVIGSVILDGKQGVLPSFQKLEFLSLQYITISACGLNNPVLCNGANLAFDKRVFQQIEGYKDTPDIASGDDVFLLSKLKKLKHAKIVCVPDENITVSSNTSETWKGFIDQRLRWAAKTALIPNNYIKLLALYNLVISVGMLVLPVIEICGDDLLFSPVFLIIKFICDWFVLKKTANQIGQGFKTREYIFSFFLYPIYFSFIFILSHFYNPVWKGRIAKRR